MKNSMILIAALAVFAASAMPQAKSNDTIARQLHSLNAEKFITFEYDSNSDVSKLMAVSENFAGDETKRAGIGAMNFAAGFYFAGQELQKAPDAMLLTFWVSAKEPKFGENHLLAVTAGDEMLVLGGGRYSSRPRDNMEYLNFEVSRANLEKIASLSNVTFRLGENEFTFTRQQLKMLADLLQLSDPQN